MTGHRLRIDSTVFRWKLWQETIKKQCFMISGFLDEKSRIPPKLFLETLGGPWNFGYSWLSWVLMMHHECSWCIMSTHDASWELMMHHEHSWYIMSTHDASWVLMMHHEYSFTSWVLCKGSMMLKYYACLPSKTFFLELIPGLPRIVSLTFPSGPPFYARHGSGWREFKTNSFK